MYFKEITDNEFLKETEDRIKAIGYAFKDADKYVLTFTANSEVEKFNNKCNTDYININLKYSLINAIVSEFYTLKLLTNGLGEEFNFEIAVKSLSEGDTSYTFDTNMTDEEKFKLLLSNLKAGSGSDYLCYRQIKW